MQNTLTNSVGLTMPLADGKKIFSNYMISIAF